MDPRSVKCQFNEGRILNIYIRASQSVFRLSLWVRTNCDDKEQVRFLFLPCQCCFLGLPKYSQADSYPVLNWTKPACKPNMSSTSDLNSLSGSMLNTQGKERYCFWNRILFLCKNWYLKLLWTCRIWESVSGQSEVKWSNEFAVMILTLSVQAEVLQSNVCNTNI